MTDETRKALESLSQTAVNRSVYWSGMENQFSRQQTDEWNKPRKLRDMHLVMKRCKASGAAAGRADLYSALALALKGLCDGEDVDFPDGHEGKVITSALRSADL